jgi:hypothetical protein
MDDNFDPTKTVKSREQRAAFKRYTVQRRGNRYYLEENYRRMIQESKLKTKMWIGVSAGVAVGVILAVSCLEAIKFFS